MIADSVVALLMHAQSSAASIRLSSKPCRHPRDADASADQNSKRRRSPEEGDLVSSRFKLMHEILKEQFQNVEAVYEGGKATFTIQIDAGLESSVAKDDDGNLLCTVHVEFFNQSAEDAKVTVESEDEKIAKNVQDCLSNAVSAANRIPL